MLFNSVTFLVFFSAVYPTYLLLRRHHKLQNAFLLVASLVFYGFWDVRFLALLAVSTGIDFVVAQKIHASEDPARRKRYLFVSIVVNLTILGFFKYFNFFTESFVAFLNAFGMSADRPTIAIALPVGISFYTFQAMSYAIDVYRKDIEPVRSIVDYGLFIAFFPHLVAGPIQRPIVLLPQVTRPRTIEWSQVHSGVFLILWGYFKKVVIADNMALIANPIFDGYTKHQGLDILIAALAFTFQIYGDFSGYSDIARGLSKLMGFELLVNFKLPYFAINPTDFWLRWHVSLSTWLRDYLYIPLGGSRGDAWKTYRNLALTMLLGGLWHGAAWNFVFWGAFHGILLIVYRLLDRSPEHEDPWSSRAAYLKVPAKMALMFALTVVGWILFRSRSLHQSIQMLARLGFSPSPGSFSLLGKLLFFTVPLLGVQIWQYKRRDLLVIPKQPAWLLMPLYGLLLAAIVVFGVRESMEFIYFQF
jgi:alginate O-acetyltransferase complex protein AlgI